MAESPCVRNCCLDQQDRCLGCGRLLVEILEWHHATKERQQQIVKQAQLRLAASQAGLKHPAASPSE